MLTASVVATTISLLLATIALCTLGHRIGRSHWFGSLAVIAFIAALSVSLTAGEIDAARYIGLALLLGAIVTAAFPHWNAIGHASFTATAAAVITFLAYALHMLVQTSLGPWALAFGLVLFLLQSAALLLLVAHTFEIVDAVCRTRWQRVEGAKNIAGFYPMVSLHVPVHNEPPELVIETLNALSRLDYPSYEVLVIDNNTTDESLWRPVEEHCEKLGARFRFFHLMPWPGYKSGALNFALAETDPRAEVIGIIDADYVVERHYLCELVGHFVDPQIAFVQTPQDYRDSAERGRYGRALYLSYLYFFKISMAMRNEYNAIIFAGTMGLIRRSAIEEVGGWDEWCITEDAELSCRLLAAGYSSLYIDQSYGRGLMPLDYAGLKKQRFRWAFGGMQLLRIHAKRLLNPWSHDKLTFAQRIAYLMGGLQWLNDPLTVAFTAILLAGGGALLFGTTLLQQPLAGAVIVTPLLFILFAVIRFLWAFRVRAGCTWREAADALTILIGLTWVVTLACTKGLFSSHGVFLRTPKQAERPRLIDACRLVGLESVLALMSGGIAMALFLQESFALLSARAVVIVLLLWQMVTYISAARTSAWSYGAARRKFLAGAVACETADCEAGPPVGIWICVVVAILSAILIALAAFGIPVPDVQIDAGTGDLALAASFICASLGKINKELS